jgi:hypothetical protein
MAVDHYDSLADVERTDRAHEVTPLGNIGKRLCIRRAARDAAFRHQQFGRDILYADKPKAMTLEDSAYPR